ncbi:Nramp family divalent metal transporter [Aquimarina pacifica]|uniref:Nramp family divalent metal transporter n=1 Tax=Aquimarina pacifica TaxID=1296415 RepID=UPI00046F1527|nr:Nramp family divalent metal transporter [Aquimarina pacifica]
MKKWWSNIGPGALVTAAFIGPGTVTMCTLAGVRFGYTLLWALVLSIIACIVLQEMAARLGIITQKGISEVIRSQCTNEIIRKILIGIIISAIFIGNVAYEAGNISGGVMGLSSIIGPLEINIGVIRFNYASLLIGILAFLILFVGNYKFLERSLIVLVLFMSISFGIVAAVTKPDFAMLLQGFVPKLSTEKLLMVVGLVGTTVVPYNLFLHASIVKEKWKHPYDLPMVRKDSMLAIGIGGVISMAIIIAGAAVNNTEINTAVDLAKSLEPVFGSASKYVLSIGLFAAGITSAITAPLAAAYVIKGCLGWDVTLKSKKFRSVWIFVLCVGVLFSSIGIKPIKVIQFAQVANGLLLPVIAGFLLWIVNKKNVLGVYTNSRFQNVLGFLILLITIFLGFRSIWNVMSSL